MTNPQTSVAAGWPPTLIASSVLFLALLALFWPTVGYMVHIWTNFETYTHGFLILPISLWLVWHKRRHLAAFSPSATPQLIVFFVGFLLLWGLARLVGVLVVEQLAFVALLVTGLASVLGLQVSKFLAFPLLFLFFAVPMGEDLLPFMMEFTATFTVEALKLTGIPVYRDGLWFSLPTGNWSVVEACSGLRYVIASVTLGVMYAYITYHTLWKRLLFIVMSAVVPILANGLRAYMIVMIGHLSKMEYATGVDHLIYGWFFFGIVMFILFWIGSFWQEEEPPPETVVPPRSFNPDGVARRALLTVAALLVVSVGGVYAFNQAEHVEARLAGDLQAPGRLGDWQRVEGGTLWPSAHLPTQQTIQERYRRGEDEVQLFVVLFPRQSQGIEAINNANRIINEPVREVSHGRRPIGLGSVGSVDANARKTVVEIDGSIQDHLVWQWYRVAGHSLTNRYLGKGLEALARLYPGRADGVWIAVSTQLQGSDRTQAEAMLADFVAHAVPRVYAEIDELLGIAD